MLVIHVPNPGEIYIADYTYEKDMRRWVSIEEAIEELLKANAPKEKDEHSEA